MSGHIHEHSTSYEEVPDLLDAIGEPTHIYVSGPMRGFDGSNFPAFFAVERVLQERWPEADIFNPGREDVERFGLHDQLAGDPSGLAAGRYLTESVTFGDAELRQALGEDLAYITGHADLLVMLPGWQASRGASAEAATASALGTRIVEWETLAAALTAESVAEDPHMHLIEPTEAVYGPQAGDLASADGEVRVTSATGGQKGSKLAAFDQISPQIETLVAEHFGKGARKYDAHNFRKGYPWSLSYSALRRHLAAFWSGKEYDNHLPTCPPDCMEHTESLHIVAVIWHAMVLAEFFHHHKEYDDRYVYTDH
jgi:hypothetical protein